MRRKEMAKASETRIPVSKETRRLVKSQKRGGQRYEDVLRRMVEQYDPDEATAHAGEDND
ncbi:hypothetical protein [Halorubrum ezzemoulense]|uniref:hypothetical protein n=1 Tax=Halorubrum ezzemoulense TaxID=337243 RepID=UPI002330C5F3|nr:hypothetical protein [Halorubrum ezzemoulense]MDB9235820.1 hypothetical protein [Halorubrum ezzemoulense]